MGLYKTIDDKILAVHEAISQKYQKATGNTNFKLMEYATNLGSFAVMASGIMAVLQGLKEDQLAYGLFAGIINLGFGSYTAIGLRNLARKREQETLDELANDIIAIDYERLHGKLVRKKARIYLLGIAILAYGLSVYSYFHPKEGPLQSMGPYLGCSYATFGLCLASSFYFADCQTQKPQKKSLWEKVKSFFTVPKLAEVTSKYQAALYPFM